MRPQGGSSILADEQACRLLDEQQAQRGLGRSAAPGHPIDSRIEDESGSKPSLHPAGTEQYVACPTGIGKSYLACALGNKACRDDLSAVYHRAPRLFAALALARGDGRYARMLKSIAKIKLLIIDDWGPEPLNADQRRDLLEIIEDRYDIGSILITSQLPLENWHDIIGDPTIADAILDRIVHNAHRIELEGESLRKTRDQTDQA